ncbi:hypothetical protein B0J14DRAFT_570857 [Halenospora varia]|nr:hypothetical protein B0J14DRAFT_570857 [Halenospora varia]
MECGHGICDVCVRIRNFSNPTKGQEYHYDMSRCPQCLAQIRFQARELPPTCQIRFLGIDRGGSRGVVSLGFLEELRQALGLHYPVQENFDYSIGTSSGGIATIGLFVRRIFAFYLEDGKYNASVLEDALKEALGLGPLFGPARLGPSGMRYAVTATMISDATLCLISNYNGKGQHCKDSRQDAPPQHLGKIPRQMA